ncbi:MAG: acid phosphatase AphA [Bdellovibrionaceae bacterium]|nr:acid phosphatase AphA [Pseudobdellovibrionaceae bacterium]
MRFLIALFFGFCFLSVSYIAVADNKPIILKAAAKKKASHYLNLRWISFKQLKNSLPKLPITVGFDVDDTVFFSSPGFFYRENNIDGPKNSNKYGKTVKAQRRSKQFWKDMNFSFDQFSIPKKIAYKLIGLHKKRGDKIYFITARPPSKKERLSLILAKHFKVPLKKLLYFSNRKTKAPIIKKLNVKIFYGDADSDITSAKEAGVRAIRILRSPLSTYKKKLSLGKFKEEILQNSAL